MGARTFDGGAAAHSLCRPPKGALGLLRLSDDGTTWRPDDGRPGIAFVGTRSRGIKIRLGWLADCRCRREERASCPRTTTTDYGVAQFRDTWGGIVTVLPEP